MQFPMSYKQRPVITHDGGGGECSDTAAAASGDGTESYAFRQLLSCNFIATQPGCHVFICVTVIINHKQQSQAAASIYRRHHKYTCEK